MIILSTFPQDFLSLNFSTLRTLVVRIDDDEGCESVEISRLWPFLLAFRSKRAVEEFVQTVEILDAIKTLREREG